MKANYNKIITKIGISNIENNDSDKPLYFIKLNFGIELLKLIVFLFITVFFILLQYNNNFIVKSNKTDILRLIYLYTFGLTFGDLMILFLIGFYLTLILHWLIPFLKNKYFRWFYAHQKVNYLTLKKQTTIFIWTNLLVIAIIYHSVLLFYRVDLHTTIISKSEILDVFKKGWIYSFTNEGSILKTKFSKELPNASFNIGVYADTLLNLPVLLTFSPYLSWIISFIIFSFSWLKLITISPRNYIKNLNNSKNTMPAIQKFVLKNKLGFYLSLQTKKIFELYALMANILKIEIYKTSFSTLLKNIKNNIELIVNHQDFIEFMSKNKTEKDLNASLKDESYVTEEVKKTSIEPDLLISAVNPNSLLINDYLTTDENKNLKTEFSSYSSEYNILNNEFYESENMQNNPLMLFYSHNENNTIFNFKSDNIVNDDIDLNTNADASTNSPNFNIDTVEIIVDDSSLNDTHPSNVSNMPKSEEKNLNDTNIYSNIEPNFLVNTTEIMHQDIDSESYKTIKLDKFDANSQVINSDLIFDFNFENNSENHFNNVHSKQTYSNIYDDNLWISPILSDNK
ncbi:hypothetical protein MBOVa_2160 [Mycoplasmopsis bovis 8790]|nr:hypothetical protein MBOVa_2160 [Mycoplasmopsis bovis 8790]